MRKRPQWISEVIFGCFFVIALTVLAQAQERPGHPDYNWLNGKWSGNGYTGTPLDIDLRVINDNEVKGSGNYRVRRGGRLYNIPAAVTGVVQGDKVTLDVFNTGSEAQTYKYRFTHVDGKLRFKRKNDEVDFEKKQ